MSKKINDDASSPLDILRDEAMELRIKAIKFLEGQIDKEYMDPTEAFEAFISITRFQPAQASAYLNSFSNNPSLWRTCVQN